MRKKMIKNKEKSKNRIRQQIKRKPNDLFKLYEKKVIDQEQYASGERLLQSQGIL